MTKFLPLLSAFALASSLGCARGPHDSSIAAHAETSVEVGSPAPTLRAVAHDGTTVDLAQLRGRPVVVYFYPKDETPGCTKEACAFRDAWERLAKRNVVLLGVKSVRPALDPRGPVLVVSTTETQTAYANARSLEASPKREKGSGAKAPNKGKSQAARPSGARKSRGPKQPE